MSLNTDNNNQRSKEDTIDLKAFFYRIVFDWYLFAIFIPTFLILGYLYTRYTDSTFKTEAIVLIRDKSNGKQGIETVLTELELFNSQKNVENEISIIKSYTLIEKAIRKLNWDVSYHLGGQIKTQELYKNTPFKVHLDSSHVQISNTPFNIEWISDSTFKLGIRANKISLYSSVSGDDRTIDSLINFSGEYKFGDTCKTEFFSFVITKGYTTFIKSEEYKYFFVCNEIDRLTISYLSKLSVDPLYKKGTVLKISITGNVMEKQIDFVNSLAESYIYNDLEEKNAVASNTIKFIDDQLAEISSKLTMAESQLEQYRESNKIVDMSLMVDREFQKLDALDQEKAELMVKDKYYHYLMKYVVSSQKITEVVAPASLGINDPLLVKLIAELNDLYSKKVDLSYSVHKDNPSMVMVDQRIASVKSSLVENLKTIIDNSDILLQDIERRIRQLNGMISRLPKTERGLVSIQREFNLNDHLYNYLLEKRAEAGIAKAANSPDNLIIDKARLSTSQLTFPDKRRIYIICLILALIIPVMIVIIKNVLNNKIRDREELLKASNIPLLGIVRHNRKKSVLPLLEHPKSAVSESFRSLRVNLQYIKSGSCKTIGITSAISGEGKTFCSINLAMSIAMTDRKTLLIGADLRKPRISKELELAKEQGLSSYLINHASFDEVIQKTKYPYLDVVTSGPVPPNPVELIGSPKMEEFIKVAQSKYDFVVIDCSPVGLVPDYLILKKFTDANLYIVRNNYSIDKTLDKINDLYDKKELTNLYLVLNDVSDFSEQYIYGYTYGYGYYEDNHTDTPIKKAISKIKKRLGL